MSEADNNEEKMEETIIEEGKAIVKFYKGQRSSTGSYNQG